MYQSCLAPSRIVPLFILLGLSSWQTFCQSPEPEEKKDAPFSTEATVTSKFMWRGQRLTDGWCFQPAATVSGKGLSFNVWGNMDLESVNEGDTLLLRENPLAVGSASGLRGRMSEVDLTAKYSGQVWKIGFETGMIAYLLPYTPQSDPSTVEMFSSISVPDIPLAPKLTAYMDVDETRKYGATGLYFELTTEHSFEISDSRLESIDLGARLGATNCGYATYWYEAAVGSGFHDAGVGASAPIRLGKGWTSTLFIGYSRLLGKYRDHQYVNLRDLYLGSAGRPSTYADTVWGGVTFSFER